MMTRRLRRTAISGPLCLAIAGAMVTAQPGAAQPIDSYADIAKIRNATPSCRDNPQNPWVGRVSGSTEGPFDNIIPVSFVGCFPDERTCERWKGRASSIVTSTLIQYSCRLRR